MNKYENQCSPLGSGFGGIKTESERFVFRGFDQFPAFCGKIELDKGILHDSLDLFDNNADFLKIRSGIFGTQSTYA